MSSVYETLAKIDVSDHVEKKGSLSYLSWAWAWHEVKTAFPDAFFTIYETENGINYFTDGKTCWVKTGVTINDSELIEYLPVMDARNKSIPLDNVTSFDINKTIKRSLTKCCALHGLGLSVYAGEDLPLTVEEEQPKEDKPKAKPKTTVKKKDPEPEKPKLASKMQVQGIRDLCIKVGKKEEVICPVYNVKSFEELTPEMAAEVFNVLKNYEARQAL